MWRTVAEWILRTVELMEGQKRQQAQIIALEKRVPDLEEALKLVSLESRHAREMEAAERDKLLLRLENVVQRMSLAAPLPRDRRDLD